METDRKRQKKTAQSQPAGLGPMIGTLWHALYLQVAAAGLPAIVLSSYSYVYSAHTVLPPVTEQTGCNVASEQNHTQKHYQHNLFDDAAASLFHFLSEDMMFVRVA